MLENVVKGPGRAMVAPKATIKRGPERPREVPDATLRIYAVAPGVHLGDGRKTRLGDVLTDNAGIAKRAGLTLVETSLLEVLLSKGVAYDRTDG